MKIFFAMPMYRGEPHPACQKALEETLNLIRQHGHEAVIGVCAGCCYVQFSRNRLVWDFLKTDADAIFFIDDDVSWSPVDALKLIESTDDVVAGVYRIKKDSEEYPVVIFTDSEARASARQDGAIDAWGVPAGMLRIKRAAIVKIIAAHPEKRYYNFIGGVREDGFYDLFPQGVYGDRWIGEDFAFCQLWRQLGGKIWVIPDMTLGHHAGERSWIGNYHQFLLRQPGGSEAQ